MSESIDFLYENNYPCPSGPDDMAAIRDTITCVQENEPPVEGYDLGRLECSTGCRERMALGALAFVADRLATYPKDDQAEISQRIDALRARIGNRASN